MYHFTLDIVRALIKMTFTEDDIKKPITIEKPDWFYINNALLEIDPVSKSFFVLTDTTTGSYIQCAGGYDRLTVEFREYTNGLFKHYVIGKMNNNPSPLKVTWTTIICKIGQIMVHETEVLNISDALILFQSFLEGCEFPYTFSKRNVTKLHIV